MIMMQSLKRSVAGPLAAVALTLFAAPAVRAETERFGVLMIQNDTPDVTIQYQVKVGDGPWVTYTVAPGKARILWHEYKNQFDRTSPPTKVRFNSAIGANPTFMIEYDLQHFAAPDKLAKFAKRYSFQKNDDNYYDLFSVN
jgi:hypothetical protein